ncbi:TPA: hypothetical protein QHO33_003828 [Citrobacter freundii]|uniref:Exclusion-determining protein ExcA n=3 Tax=Enterobacteriaceae TaxID=543 RepID=A0A2Z5WQS5_KLEPN|nr:MULTISPECIES: hypothetical protein [Klebsiella]EDI0720954.1 hypothetical protein [Salmonella enterica subsp. enterica serovar Montevideo]EEX0625126.1 hypothetical protein [Escherichia coli]BCR34749.1 hypothetical protein [Enterobacter cloacae]BEN91373.1 hypothetical protein SMQC07_51720 [Serratia marcescens]GJL40903.1 hypothetical protein TUM17577_21120 [Enterobacter asburiae]HDS5007587.1 hypothetical protein [Enterobacter hormaechei subsp. hoffmannii]HDS5021623.1 hypothetical protein [En
MKGYSYTVVDNNMAKSKGVGYYLSRLSVAISIVILTISLPLTVYSSFLTLGGSLALAWFVVLLIFDAMLITYVVRQVKSKGVKKVVAGMRVYGCFNPSAKEEQYMPAQKTYFGIDMDSGVVGIAALYAVQASIKQKRILFEAETIESWEYTDSKLVVNLRNRHVPTVEIILLNAGLAYRQLEMLTRMNEQHKKYRGEKYLQWRKNMLDEGWMLPRTY